MKSLLISSILILLISFSNQTCIPGENCPYNQGECQDDQCICKDGFFTLIDSSKSEIDQVFCDYGQISIKLMLLFEVVLPSAGQFYAKRWIHGIVKLVIVACFLFTSLFITKKCLIPKCYIVIKNAFLGGDDDKKKIKIKTKMIKMVPIKKIMMMVRMIINMMLMMKIWFLIACNSKV